MGMRSGTTFKKRQKELARMEKQRDKAARRLQKKTEGPGDSDNPNADLMGPNGETVGPNGELIGEDGEIVMPGIPMSGAAGKDSSQGNE
jgi:hypothetical protein